VWGAFNRSSSCKASALRRKIKDLRVWRLIWLRLGPVSVVLRLFLRFSAFDIVARIALYVVPQISLRVKKTLFFRFLLSPSRRHFVFLYVFITKEISDGRKPKQEQQLFR